MKSSKIVMAAAMAVALASMGCKQALTKDEFIAASKELQSSNSSSNNDTYQKKRLTREAWRSLTEELKNLFTATTEATVTKAAIEARVTAFNERQKKVPHKIYGKQPYCTFTYKGGDLKKADYPFSPYPSSLSNKDDAKLAELFDYKIEGDLNAY